MTMTRKQTCDTCRPEAVAETEQPLPPNRRTRSLTKQLDVRSNPNSQNTGPDIPSFGSAAWWGDIKIKSS